MGKLEVIFKIRLAYPLLCTGVAEILRATQAMEAGLSKSETSTLLGISEISLLGFGVVLVIGLVGEVAKSDKWKKRVRLFEMLVIIGVAGELIADGGVFLFSRHLQTISEAEYSGLNKQAADAYKQAEVARKEADSFELDIAKAKKQAADALARAAKAEETLGEARRDAAMANERAAKSNEIAEGERLARLRLEARLAPRSLSPAQQRDLGEKLKLFKGSAVDIFVYGETPEILNITTSIESVLQSESVGWNAKFWVVTGGGAVTGILVLTRSGSDAPTLQAARSLLAGLNSEGISASPWKPFTEADTPGMLSGPPWDNNKMAPIRMLIGTKP